MEAFFNHLNPAVIRSIMLKMNKQEFIETAQFIKKQAIELEPGTKRSMYVKLYGWCRKTYKSI